jgi:hypothetical protein
VTLFTIPPDRDRYIAGIYNYCDSWCSACPLAARCRVKTEMDAETPPETPEALAAQLHGWFHKALDLAEAHARDLGIDLSQVPEVEYEAERPPLVSLEQARLISRAKAYGHAVFAWQRLRPPDPERKEALDPAFPQDVIDHFALMIGSKVERAVSGLGFEKEDGYDDEGWPKDSDGSAKVAILAAERSRAAWSDLRDSGLVSDETVQGFEQSLAWLISELDRVFPNARRFVRPGFDRQAPGFDA